MTEAVTPDAPAAETTTDAPTETPDAPDLSAEVEKWKALSKKNEERAKANAKAATELEELKRTAMSETERAVAAARDEGRAEGLRNAGGRLVEAEVRAAAKGRVSDVDALLEVLNPSKFLNDDGEPDRDAITAWVDRFAPEEEDAPPAGFPSLEQGPRGAPAARSANPLLNDLTAKLGIR